MGWASGTDANGREIGYGVDAACDEPGCNETIDRGLAYRCGPLDSETPGVDGCGNFYCGRHLYMDSRASPGGGFCARCTQDDDEE